MDPEEHFQNHQNEEHFGQSIAYLDFNTGKLYFRMQIILECSIYSFLNTFLLIKFNVLIKLCEYFRIRRTSNTLSGSVVRFGSIQYCCQPKSVVKRLGVDFV